MNNQKNQNQQPQASRQDQIDKTPGNKQQQANREQQNNNQQPSDEEEEEEE